MHRDGRAYNSRFSLFVDPSPPYPLRTRLDTLRYLSHIGSLVVTALEGGPIFSQVPAKFPFRTQPVNRPETPKKNMECRHCPLGSSTRNEVINHKRTLFCAVFRSRRSVLHRRPGRIMASSVGVRWHADSGHGHGSAARRSRPSGAPSASATGSVRQLNLY